MLKILFFFFFFLPPPIQAEPQKELNLVLDKVGRCCRFSVASVLLRLYKQASINLHHTFLRFSVFRSMYNVFGLKKLDNNVMALFYTVYIFGVSSINCSLVNSIVDRARFSG